MLDFRMQTFLTVCRTMNFTRAAEELHITQPAVSQHMHYLERAYGTTLFRYAGKQLHLTEQGEVLRKAAATMLHNERKLREELQTMAQKRRLDFGATLTAAEYIIARPIAKYTRQHPEVELHMAVADTQELLELLDAGQLDCALIEGFVEKNAYEWTCYRTEELIAVCSAADADVADVCSMEALLRRRILLREYGSGTRAVLEHALEAQNISVRDFAGLVEVSSINVIKAMAEEGCGIAFLYESAVRRELQNGSLHRIWLSDVRIEHDLTCVWQKGSLFADAYRAFFEAIKSAEAT